MDISLLNSFRGDKKIEIDTDTPEGRAKVVEVFKDLLHSGSAIFLERADRVYRITGYDPETDKIIVQVPNQAVCACKTCEGCTNRISTRSRTGICSPCQQGQHSRLGFPVAESGSQPEEETDPLAGTEAAVGSDYKPHEEDRIITRREAGKKHGQRGWVNVKTKASTGEIISVAPVAGG